MSKITSLLGPIGQKTHAVLGEVSRFFNLLAESFYWAFSAPLLKKRGLNREALTKQLVFMGNDSLFIVTLVAAAVGAVLALQAAYQLKQFGALIYTGGLVALSMTRELGPVVTAIVIAGRVGASITAEIGTMKVQEEVDALTTMGIPPVPYLIVPRVVSITLMLPTLTVLADSLGMLGGFMIGTLGLGIPATLYIQESFDALVPKDILTGIAKSFLFAILIGFIATYKGLTVKGGADGVGRATTQSVVLSIIAIILGDCLATAFFYYVIP